MERKAAIFDVDGTLVNGNCTQILLQFLFDNKGLKPEDLSFYNRILKSYSHKPEDKVSLATEAFKLLSSIDEVELLKHWELCFNAKIKNRFNQTIIEELNNKRNSGAEVFLASGSPQLLISKVAAFLGIPSKNILGSEFRNSKNTNKQPEYWVCMGENKKNAVLDILRHHRIQVKDVIFYSDNLSDMDLLLMSGKGYWLGGVELYNSSSMKELGIDDKFNIHQNKTPPQRPKKKDNDAWADYYTSKLPLIEESIASILPQISTSETIQFLIGGEYGHWDLSVMQKSYFDPIYDYLCKNDNKLYSLGICIFLEAGNLKLADHLPIIGIGDLLGKSHEMFSDIAKWTSLDAPAHIDKTNAEISILGNASISLLTLPAHNIIFNRISTDPDIKLKLFEAYTSLVFQSLFGNGLRLYWENQEEKHPNEDEYFFIAELANQSFFKLPSYLYLILSKQDSNGQLKSLYDQFSIIAARYIQLENDLKTFERWQLNSNEFFKNGMIKETNLIMIHAYESNRIRNSENGESRYKDFNELIENTDSINYVEGKIEEYTVKLEQLIELFPFEAKYRRLIRLYVDEVIGIYSF